MKYYRCGAIPCDQTATNTAHYSDGDSVPLCADHLESDIMSGNPDSGEMVVWWV